jgi:hypothetical protein
MRVALAVMLIITAIGTTLYWLDFFLRGTVHVVEEDWYLRFERSFPVADAWMAGASAVAAAGLFADADYGIAFALVAAGALVFLGLMDLTFNVQNGLFRLLPRSGEMWTEVVIITWCLTLGGSLLSYAGGRVG